MAASDVKKIYQDVINDVCSAVREALSEEGYDDHTLQELRTLWLGKLENSRALEPIPTSIADQATTREYRRPTAATTTTTGETNNSLLLNNHKITAGPRTNQLHPASNAAVNTFHTAYSTSTNPSAGILINPNSTNAQFIRTNFSTTSNPTNIGNATMKTSNQLDGANDEIIYKKLKSRRNKSNKIEISFQLDGTGPPVGDDDDDDEDDSELGDNNVGDDVDDDDDDDANEGGREDPRPLCSDDDVSEDEPSELFDADNVVVCQYDKISRIKNKWRFTLKSGVMNIDGRDYVFNKAIGDADW